MVVKKVNEYRPATVKARKMNNQDLAEVVSASMKELASDMQRTRESVRRIPQDINDACSKLPPVRIRKEDMEAIHQAVNVLLQAKETSDDNRMKWMTITSVCCVVLTVLSMLIMLLH